MEEMVMMNRTQLATIGSMLMALSATNSAASPQAETPATDGPRTAAAVHSARSADIAGSRLQLELVRSAEEDDLERAKVLLRKGVAPDGALGDGATALHWAAYNDDLPLTQLLIAAGAKPDARTRLRGLTPLHMAAETGDAVLIDALLNAGAKVDAPNESGTTPLMIASASGSTAAVTSLLVHGADVNAREKTNGETALFFAASRDRAEVVRLLLSKGADAGVTTPVSKLARVTVGPDGELLDNKKNAKEGDKPDGSDAAKAANSLASNSPADKKPAEAKPEEADAEKAKAAAAKPDDKVKDAYGFTAADRQKRVFGATQFGGLTALLVAARDGQVNAVNAFLDAGVDVNRTSDTDHATPLILAVINGHYDLAKVLLDRGANPRSATTDGATALYAVIDVQWAPHTWYAQPIVANEHIGYLDVISALLMHGADPNAAIGKKLWFRSFANDETWFDVEGATPFLRAAMAGDLSAMKLLADRGANPNLATKSGDTPLMTAAGVGWAAYWTQNAPYSRLDAVKFCLEHGAVVSARDAKGYSALEGAAFRGDNELVNYLIAKGADVHAKTKAGDTVADLANGLFEHAVVHPETVALLERLGSVNSHNCRSNECVVPTKEDKPAVVAKNATPADAQVAKSPVPPTQPTAGAQSSAIPLENKPK
jgi:ankyrin repeat protein